MSDKNLHAVAEPHSDKWHGFIGGLNGKPEFCKYCGEPERSYRHVPAHAAEQPKLTEEVQAILKKVDEDARGTRCLTMAEVTICLALLKKLGTALLTSPVAPPLEKEKQNESA